MIRIEIPRKMFTNNEMRRWYSNPRSRFTGAKMYAGWKQTLKDELFVGASSHCNTGKPRARKKIRVLYLTKRLQDKDNFYASLKPLLDAMVDLELLRDDSEEWLSLHAEQRVDRNLAYTIIVEIH